MFLQPGDIVDVIAPASGGPRTALTKCEKILRSLQLVPRIPRDIFSHKVSFCAQAEEIRLKHLKAALKAKDSKAIWCYRGGYGSFSLLKGLWKMSPPPTPKFLIGYSDITALHVFLNTHWGWPSLHGPVLDEWVSYKVGVAQRYEQADILFGVKSRLKFKGLKPLNVRAKTQKQIRGKVTGGNLTILTTALGTPWQSDFSGCILILEDVEERGYEVDRLLRQLEFSNSLKGVRAVIFGNFVGGRESDGQFLWRKAFSDFAERVKIPVFSGIEVGHTYFQKPVVFGLPAVIEKRALSINL